MSRLRKPITSVAILPVFRMKASALLVSTLVLARCANTTGETLPPPPPPDDPPLPVRVNIAGTHDGTVEGATWRLRISDEAGTLSGSYERKGSSPTAEFEVQGTFTGTGTQLLQLQTQEISLSFAGNYIGAFSGNATGRSRIRGTLEYRRGDQTETRTADVTFLRAGF